MFLASWTAETGRWDGGALVPYGPLALLPAAQVLNYGQSIFEGLKAYRAPPTAAAAPAAAAPAAPAIHNGGGAHAVEQPSASGTPQREQQEQGQRDRVLLFRPDANAARFAAGAARMAMPPVPPDMFMAALHAVCRANADWVPPQSVGSLYLRPLLLGTGPLLGLCPAPSYTFLVYAVPVGGRAKAGRLSALDYLIHDSLHRAAPRGVGSTKAAGNYSPCLMAQAEARAAGCHDCIYLDARSDTYLEEGSGCNVFTVHGRTLTTPPAAGSILPGITRASLLSLAAALGYGVREAPITVDDAMRADEMFASGTAVVVQPIGSVTYKGQRSRFHSRAAATALNSAVSTSPHPSGSACAAASAPAGCSAAAAAGRRDCGAGEPGEPRCSDGEASDAGSDAGLGARGVSSISSSSDASNSSTSSGYDAGSNGGDLSDEQRMLLAQHAPEPDASALPPGVGPVAQRLYGLLTAIQYGRAPDPFGWMMEVDMEGPTDGPLQLDEALGLVDAAEVEALSEVAAKAKGGIIPAGRSVFADANLE